MGRKVCMGATRREVRRGAKGVQVGRNKKNLIHPPLLNLNPNYLVISDFTLLYSKIKGTSVQICFHTMPNNKLCGS